MGDFKLAKNVKLVQMKEDYAKEKKVKAVVKKEISEN